MIACYRIDGLSSVREIARNGLPKPDATLAGFVETCISLADASVTVIVISNESETL